MSNKLKICPNCKANLEKEGVNEVLKCENWQRYIKEKGKWRKFGEYETDGDPQESFIECANCNYQLPPKFQELYEAILVEAD